MISGHSLTPADNKHSYGKAFTIIFLSSLSLCGVEVENLAFEEIKTSGTAHI